MNCKYLYLILFALLLGSCSSYERILRGDDLAAKEAKAMEFYNKKEYQKAIPFFEEVIGFYKGNKKAEDLYYYYSMCFYGAEEYLMAAYNLKNFVNSFESSPRAEECLFLNAMCYYHMSPRYNQDQTNTTKAMNEFQLFINMYPSSPRVLECNTMIDQLRRKLEAKDYASAKLYFDMSNYKAANTAFSNLLMKYSDSPISDQISFMSLKSSYLYAVNSIDQKKKERLAQTIELYNTFVSRFPEIAYHKDAKGIFENAQRLLNKTTKNEQNN
jgi:outer membrane protein assembly factor BamD